MYHHFDAYLERQSIGYTNESKPVQHIVATVTEEIAKLSHNEPKSVVLKEAAKAIAKYSRNAWGTAREQTPCPERIERYTKADVKNAAFCLAVAMQRTDIMQSLVADGACVWQDSEVLGPPIRVAIQTGNPHILKLVLDLQAQNRSDLPKKKRK